MILYGCNRKVVNIKTYQDLLKAGANEQERMNFILDAISEHKTSTAYNTAKDAKIYAAGNNATIAKYEKVLYTAAGEAVPDRFTANHKTKSGFFKLFITQEVAHLVGNGVNFDKKETKAKLGRKIDQTVYKGVKSACVQGVSFFFWNLDHLELFELTEFVPLYDEHDGMMKAGVRFWQISSDKPLRATLFELDGYTEYVTQKKSSKLAIMTPKRNYKQIVTHSPDGDVISDGGNYPSFPIVPLYGNMEHQSELEGHREAIDCYDLIKSGFANDLDDAAMIYWTLTNCGGMDDVDFAKFVEKMKLLKAAAVEGDEGAKVEAHTMEVPYQGRETYLTRLEKDLYRDFMALDVSQIAAGNVTATQIKAAYEPLDEKCDELEMCICDLFDAIFLVAGIADDAVKLERTWISNQMELTQMILSAAEYLDDETILNKLPFLTADEIKGVIKRRDKEETERFKLKKGAEPPANDGAGDDDDEGDEE